MKTRLVRWVAQLLIVTMVPFALPPTASAGIVATDEISASAERHRVKAFLEREDVREQLQARGVDADQAQARVDALTDQEVSRIARHIDTLPAGADGVGAVIGAAVLIFIILLITDILGFTKVFPFTRAAR